MKCTIKDIAVELEMSRNTVAKVLSGKSGVSARTKAIVLQKAREMKYDFEDGTAELFSPADTEEIETHNSILLLTRSSFNLSDFWIKVMNGIESVLKENNYSLVLGVMDDTAIEKLQFPSIINHSDIKGIILVELCEPELCKAVMKYHLPTLSLDMPKNYMQFLDKMDIITMENKLPICQLTEQLIDRGFKRFAFAGTLNAANVSSGFQERYDSLCETLEKHNLHIIDECCFIDEPRYLFANSNYMITKLQSMETIPEVYFCGNDWTAIQLINAMQFLNYRIPEDVSIVGFDDIQDAAQITPPLTTVRTNKEYLGIAAANCILNRIRHPETPYVYSQYMTQIILRESANLK